MSYLVDSSVWIDFLRGTASPQAVWLARALDEDEVTGIAGLVAAEVLQGVSPPPLARRIEQLFAEFDRIPDLTFDDCLDAARLWRDCRARGVTIRSTVDCLIAQQALRHGLTLVTCDRDFVGLARVAPLQLLQLPPN